MVERNLPVKSTSNFAIIMYNFVGVGLICAYHQYFYFTAGYPCYPFEAKMVMTDQVVFFSTPAVLGSIIGIIYKYIVGALTTEKIKTN